MDIAGKMTSKTELDINMAVLYGEKCGLLFALSDYEEVNKDYSVYDMEFIIIVLELIKSLVDTGHVLLQISESLPIC